MGSSTEFDEEAIKYLNNLFNELTRQNSLNSKTETIPNTTKEKSSNEEVSDSWQTIAWKLGLALIGAIILLTLFPNIFSDKIVVTNPYTGEQIEFPVETTTIDGEENYCINISILEGAERTFCSADKEALSNFTAKVKEQEAKMIAEMAFRGQSVSSEATELFSLDNIIYAGPKNQYHIYEQNPQTEQGTSNKVKHEANDEEQYYIGDEEIITKTYNYKGIDIEYDSNSNSISEISTVAKQCYNEGNTDSESLNQCVGVKLKWF